MEKALYLFKLRFMLLWRHGSSEVNMIISDYQEYFNEGLSDGKTVGDLIEKLGSPACVVASLDDDRSVWAPMLFIARSLLALVLLLVTIAYLRDIYSDQLRGWLDSGMVLVTFACVLLISGSDFRQRPATIREIQSDNMKGVRRLISIHLLVSILSVLAVAMTIKHYTTYQEYPFGFPKTYSSQYYFVLFRLATGVGAIVTYKIIKDSRRLTYTGYYLIFWILGLTYSINTLAGKLANVQVESEIFESWWLYFIPMLVGLMASIGSYQLQVIASENKGLR